MSDRVYKAVHNHAAPDGNTADAGKFAEIQFSLTTNPSVGDTIQIVWNGVTRTYTFSDNPNAADSRRHHNLNLTEVLIGVNVSETMKNIVTAVHSNSNSVAKGKDDTISIAVIDNPTTAIQVYSNAKITGSITIGGTASTTTSGSIAGVDMENVYTTGKSYTGFQPHHSTLDVIVRKHGDDTDGYDVGPAINQLEVVTLSNLDNKTIYPIETFGCSKTCTVYA